MTKCTSRKEWWWNCNKLCSDRDGSVTDNNTNNGVFRQDTIENDIKSIRSEQDVFRSGILDDERD